MLSFMTGDRGRADDAHRSGIETLVQPIRREAEQGNCYRAFVEKCLRMVMHVPELFQQTSSIIDVIIRIPRPVGSICKGSECLMISGLKPIPWSSISKVIWVVVI